MYRACLLTLIVLLGSPLLLPLLKGLGLEMTYRMSGALAMTVWLARRLPILSRAVPILMSLLGPRTSAR